MFDKVLGSKYRTALPSCQTLRARPCQGQGWGRTALELELELETVSVV